MDRFSGHRLCFRCLYEDIREKIRSSITPYIRDLRNSVIVYVEPFQPVIWGRVIVDILARIIKKGDNKMLIITYPWHKNVLESDLGSGIENIIIVDDNVLNSIMNTCLSYDREIELYTCLLKHQIVLSLEILEKSTVRSRIVALARPREALVRIGLKAFINSSRELVSEIYGVRLVRDRRIVNILDRVSEESLNAYSIRVKGLSDLYTESLYEFIRRVPREIWKMFFDRENRVISSFDEIFSSSREFIYTFPAALSRYYSHYESKCDLCEAPINASSGRFCKYCSKLLSIFENFS